MLNDVTKLRAPFRTIPESSPKGDSQANGSVERGDRYAKAQIQALLSALEADLGCKIEFTHPVMTWLVQHSGYILTNYTVSRDGLTCCERLKGKPNNVELCEFGEQVHYTQS